MSCYIERVYENKVNICTACLLFAVPHLRPVCFNTQTENLLSRSSLCLVLLRRSGIIHQNNTAVFNGNFSVVLILNLKTCTCFPSVESVYG